MFSRNSWIYDTLFSRMSSAQAADLNTLAEVVDEFTVVRLDPTGEQPALPSVEPYSQPVREMATIFALILGIRPVVRALTIWPGGRQGSRLLTLNFPYVPPACRVVVLKPNQTSNSTPCASGNSAE